MRSTRALRVPCLALLCAAALASSTEPSRAATPEPGCATPFIQEHLRVVERELLAADISHLDAARRARRAEQVRALAAYRERCEFPLNTLAPDRLVTVFVDERDVPCAVAHLMRHDGRVDLVARLAATRNTATIQEMGADPEVVAWLEGVGLSPAEAARIQPSYCFSNRGGSCLCGGNSAAGDAIGVGEAIITSVDVEYGEVTAVVTRVHGEGLTVGQSKRVSRVALDEEGRKILVVAWRNDSADRTLRGADPIAGGEVSCTSGYASDPKYCAHVPSEVYVQALLSEDCMASLEAHDPALALSVCDLGGAACGDDGTPPSSGDDGGGCGGGGSAGRGGWIAGLIALLLAARARAAHLRA
ncbi:MAG: hypothetical protein IT385_25160 [Deltaproteobacteria bacterium]|nr:hypothetical protein [Deltaproteobacteria bacterium]